MKNNVRGSVIILEVIAIVIISALIMRIKAGRDVVPPVISFPEGIVSYTQGDDPEVLLSGVTAIDDRDGDVTDNIMISSVSVTGNGEAIAVYHAKDSSNNVAMAVRSIEFTPDDTVGLLGIPVNTEPVDIEVLPDEDNDDRSVSEETETGDYGESHISDMNTENGNTHDGDASDDGTTAAGGDVGTDSFNEDSADGDADASIMQEMQPESAEAILASYESTDPDSYSGEDMEKIGSALRSETETACRNLPEGAPTIGLMAHAIYQDIGSNLNPLDLISSIDDAEDSIDYIFGQIHVEGNSGFTTDYPGKYVFRYYVIDSDGNMSNVARLYVVVR